MSEIKITVGLSKLDPKEFGIHRKPLTNVEKEEIHLHAVEMNRIASEKRKLREILNKKITDDVLKYIINYGCPVTIKMISKKFKITEDKVRTVLFDDLNKVVESIGCGYYQTKGDLK